MKLRTKLYGGFSILTVLALIIGITSLVIARQVGTQSSLMVDYAESSNKMNEMYEAHLIWKSNVEETFLFNLDQIDVQLDGHKCGFGSYFYGDDMVALKSLSSETATILTEVEDVHLELHDSVRKINDDWATVHPGLLVKLQSSLIQHQKWALDVSSSITEHRKITSEADPTKCDFGKFLESSDSLDIEQSWPFYKEEMSEIKVEHRKLHSLIGDLNSTDNTEEQVEIFENKLLPLLADLSDRFNKIINEELKLEDIQSKAINSFNSETIKQLDLVLDKLNSAKNQLLNEKDDSNILLQKSLTNQNITISIVLILIIFIAVFLSIYITRSILKQLGIDPEEILTISNLITKGNLDIKFDRKKPLIGVHKSLYLMIQKLQEVVRNVQSSSNNVASGSAQLTDTSVQMSQGATEQAASIEEISSSMEEMVSNIKRNADNSSQTEKIAMKSAIDAENGSSAVNETVDAMKGIAQKITIIEEIARNTNLLALNASIEAARAGEYGKGFAVVASEVGKLADRSQIAAAEINTLAKNSVKIAEDAGNTIATMIPDIRQTSDLIQEISASSNEQNAGASQINQAIMQLDKVIQQNAAVSEESSSMAEELSSQAEVLKDVISFFKLSKNDTQKVRVVSKTALEKNIKEPIKTKVLPIKSSSAIGVDISLDDDNRGIALDNLDDDYDEF